MNGDLGTARIRIDADTEQAVRNLKNVSRNLTSLVPGGNAVSSVFERIQGGALQLVQGLSRNIFQNITSSMTKMVSAGIDVAKTIESARVGFDTLLESGEDVDKLLLKIQEDAAKTPFDTDALTLSTQKIALITKNGGQAERAILNLGKATAAAGRGTAELNRMATNLQQIGTNAKVTERDLREFGNAGINISDIVVNFSDEFKESGRQVTEVTDWLKEIDTPFEVIVNALNKAGESVDGFADIYEKGAQTIGQAIENMQDSMGIFSYRVMQQSTVLDKAKNIFKEFQESLFLDKTFTANTAEAIGHLAQMVNELDIIRPIIDGIKKAVSAFASGQFDNVIVFFKNLFNAIKQFSGIRTVVQVFRTIVDLFSDNHTAEEVARVATQIGNLIRTLMELKFLMKVTGYVYNLFYTITTGIGSMVQAVGGVFKFVASLKTLRLGTLGTVAAVVALVAAIAFLASNAGGGVSEVFNNIGNAVKSFGDFLGDVAKKMGTFGWNIIVGLYNGIVDAAKAVIGKIKEIAQSITTTFAKVLGIHSPSTVMRDYIGRNIALGIAEGIRENYGTVVTAAEEVLDELVSLQDSYVKELGNFGALDLVQQVEVYKNFAQLYRQGTKARLEMDSKVHDAETAIVKEMISLIETFNKEYDKAYSKAKDYYNMFEYTQATLRRTTASVIEGLRRQNDNMTKYYNNIYQMSQMGFNDDFMAYVYDQGIDAASEVAGLADATREQIEEINELWETRGAVAGRIATLNTRKLKDETLDELDYLQSGLDTKVLDYYDSGTYLMYNFARGIYDMMPTLEDAVANVAAKASGKADDAIENVGAKLDDLNPEDLADKFTAALKKMDLKIFDTTDLLSFLKNALSEMPWYMWVAAGLSAFTAISNGLKNLAGAGKVVKQGAEVALHKIAGTFKQTTTTVTTFADKSKEASNIFATSGNKVSSVATDIQNDIERSTTKTTDTIWKESQKQNQYTYSASGKIGANLLRPFKTLNTRISGAFSVVKNTINEFFSIFGDMISKFVDWIGGLFVKVNTYVGEGFKALLEPLKDKKLLTGVFVLAGLATTILILAEAGKKFDEVSWEGMAKMGVVVVALGAIAAVFAAVSKWSAEIMAGAVAFAVAGLALDVAVSAIAAAIYRLSESLSAASKFGEEISFENLGKLLVAIGGAIGSAIALAGPATVAAAAAAPILVFLWEMVKISEAVGTISEASKDIGLEGLDNFGVAVEKLRGIDLGNVVGNFFGSWAAKNLVGAMEHLAEIARAVAIVSDNSQNIDLQGIDSMKEAIGKLRTIDLGDVVGNFFGGWAARNLVGAINNLAEISQGVAIISEKSQNVNLRGISNLKDAIKNIRSIDLGDVIGNMFGAWSANNLIGVVESVDKVLDSVISITEKMRKLDEVNKTKTDEYLVKIQWIMMLVSQISPKNWIDAVNRDWASDALEGVVTSVDNVLTSVKNIVKKFKEIGKVVPKDTTTTDILKDVKEIMGKVAELVNGDWIKSLKQSKQAEKLQNMAANVDITLGSVQSMCNKMKEFHDQGISKDDVTDMVNKVKEIMWKLAEISFSQSFDSLGDTAGKAGKLMDMAGSFDAALGTIQSMCNKLKEFADQGITPTDVENRVEDIKKIMWKLAEITFSQDMEVSATQAENLNRAATNFDAILGTVREMCNKLAAFTESGYNVGGGGDKDVLAMISNANSIITELAKISIDTEKDAISELAEKSDTLSQLAQHVNDILSKITDTVEIMKRFHEAYKETTVAAQVEDINGILEALIYDGTDEDKGIIIPDSLMGDEDLANLDRVKSALDKIKEISDVMQNIQSVSDKIADVQSVVNFIKDTMAQLPAAIGDYSNDFKMQGEAMAAAFIEGWKNKYGEGREVAHGMQEAFWKTLQDKMNDEFEQGKWMAHKFIDGWRDYVRSDAYNAGVEMQSAIWRGVEDHVGDMWWQGHWLGEQEAAGVKQGMEDNLYQISNAAVAISETAVEKIRKILRINSPSKVMAELGGYVAEGFADGITDDLAEVESAGEKLAQAVMDGYNGAIEPLQISAYEARMAADGGRLGYGSSTRNTSVIQNNNIYNNMDMSQALGQIAWEVSRA